MYIDRRQFLSVAGTIGVGVAVIGTRAGTQAYARSEMHSRLGLAANPVLSRTASQEFKDLPLLARERIEEVFHGLCINNFRFVNQICSVRFANSLSQCKTEKEKQDRFALAFTEAVASESQIQGFVETIAIEIGATLNANWIACCEEIAHSWVGQAKEYPASKFENQQLSKATEELIAAELHRIQSQALTLSRRVSLDATVKNIGKTAILLMLTESIAPAVLIPSFLLSAILDLYEFFTGQLGQDTAGYQRQITSRLSVLGRRIGVLFEKEIHDRIADLHIWRGRALDEAMDRNVQEMIPLLL